MPVDSPGLWRVVQMRATSVAVVLVVTWCQALATVAFQTVTNNRIIAPSIVRLESLYRLVQTSIIFFFGIIGPTSTDSTGQYFMQVGLMVALAMLSYSWIPRNEHTDIHQMPLLGIIIGTGFGTLSTYMQNLPNPLTFDILSARLTDNVSNVDVSQLTVATPPTLVTGGLLLAMSRALGVLGLGCNATIGLDVDHRRDSLVILTLTAVSVAISTSLVGPISFLGFLMVMAARQLSDTHKHRFVLLIAWLARVVTLGGAYFILQYVFYVTGFVGVIIETVSGTLFFIHLLRKGQL